jgi:hypothetical protein
MRSHLLLGAATGLTALVLLYGVAVAFWVYVIGLPTVFLITVAYNTYRRRPWWRKDSSQ